jgi:hypothetical protein
MSQSPLKDVLERAIDDADFRQLLFHNPDEALKDYNLSEDDRKKLSKLDEDNFDDFAGPLSGRTTKGQWVPTG